MKSTEPHFASRIVVLIPCFNEEKNIPSLARELSNLLSGYTFKIIFIDDGSTDNSLTVLKVLSATNTNIFFLSLSRNFGHQIALKAGYDSVVEADCVICIDADFQQPPISILDLIRKWNEGYDIVNAVRRTNSSIPFLKRIFSSLFYYTINSFSKDKILTNGPDFRLIDKKVLEVVKSIKEQNIFFRELISWVGFKQTTIEFEVAKRLWGQPKYTWRKMFALCKVGMFAYGISPLRLSISIGLMFSFLSFIYGFYAVYSYLTNSGTVPGWTSIIASFLFISGFQYVLMGIIGKYIGKTYLESRNRPVYVVSDSNIQKETFKLPSITKQI